MNRALDLDAVAEACIAAHAAIEEHGTPEMKALIRTLLLIVGKEIARGISTSDKREGHAYDGIKQFQRLLDDPT